MDTMYLHGADDVRSGGRSMVEAASTMSGAVSNMEFALQRHQQFLDEWLYRFQDVVKAISPHASDCGIWVNEPCNCITGRSV